MTQPANLAEWYHQECGECGIPWDTPSPECPKRIFNRHPLTSLESKHPMPGNDHDLIMQFARGTEALSLFDVLSNLEKSFQTEKSVIDTRYARDVQAMQERYANQVFSAVSTVRRRLDDLTPAVTSADDDRNDDD